MRASRKKKGVRRWHMICRLVGTAGEIVGAELGVYEATNAQELLRRIPGLTLYCVDRWQRYPREEIANPSFTNLTTKDQRFYNRVYEKAVQRLSEFGERAIIKKGETREMAAEVPDGLDFVFVDAGHKYDAVFHDILIWLPKIRKGGWMIGHDYGSKHHPEVKQAVDDFFKERNVSHGKDRTWWVKKA